MDVIAKRASRVFLGQAEPGPFVEDLEAASEVDSFLVRVIEDYGVAAEELDSIQLALDSPPLARLASRVRQAAGQLESARARIAAFLRRLEQVDASIAAAMAAGTRPDPASAKELIGEATQLGRWLDDPKIVTEADIEELNGDLSSRKLADIGRTLRIGELDDHINFFDIADRLKRYSSPRG